MVLEHERYYGLGIDALVIVCSRTWTSLWVGHGCSGSGMLSNMDIFVVWAYYEFRVQDFLHLCYAVEARDISLKR